MIGLRKRLISGLSTLLPVCRRLALLPSCHACRSGARCVSARAVKAFPVEPCDLVGQTRENGNLKNTSLPSSHIRDQKPGPLRLPENPRERACLCLWKRESSGIRNSTVVRHHVPSSPSNMLMRSSYHVDQPSEDAMKGARGSHESEPRYPSSVALVIV